jgi:uncharacterized protein (TIGR00369 family)
MTTEIPVEAEEISIRGFNQFVGPLYRLPDKAERPRFAFVAAEKHMNAAGSVHGGMLITLADVAMSRTARLTSKATSCSTVSLSCDFLAPGGLGETIEAEVRVTRLARTMVFLSAEITASGRPLLVANGVWRVRHAE